MNWIRVETNEEDLKLAKEYTEIEIENMEFEPLFQTNEYQNHLIGHLGQIKFHHWLKSKGILHKYINDLSGLSDNGEDFIINKYVIDVKTANCSTSIHKINNNYRFFIPQQQLDGHYDTDFYVNMQLPSDENSVYIMGVIHRDIAKMQPVKLYKNNYNPAYNIPMIELIPIETWLKSIVTDKDKEISLDQFHF